ncbi:hypothetical protein [Bifidobacterium sp. SO1]|uniref:hypothetical protein n=1 Tax=Bifidobacterium sp. SO1 TaxID=2809029 RepID=UPI001BDBED4C|nr:hypothetical protein [Bifidobacterium sp. SO1]MBT1162794.1 hypothetical protein [Bifidobacterium sp. SO1]
MIPAMLLSMIGVCFTYGWIVDRFGSIPVGQAGQLIVALEERPEQTRYWLRQCWEHDFTQVPIVERYGRLVNGRFTGDGFPVEESERSGVNAAWNPIRFRWEAVTNENTATIRLVADCATLGDVQPPAIREP